MLYSQDSQIHHLLTFVYAYHWRTMLHASYWVMRCKLIFSSLHVHHCWQMSSTLPSLWDSLLAEAQEGGCHCHHRMARTAAYSQSHSVIEDLYKYMETEVHVYTSIAVVMGVIWRDKQRCTPKTGIHELHIHVLYMHTQVQFCAKEMLMQSIR